uniref:ADP-ribosylation factor-like protein 2-binding protein n=1 Tax=Sus scrofa TaxID=9823 RepID=A0A8D0XR17_PIG
MDALEEESFALSFSSASDAEFDAVVGYLEDIIMDDEFQLLQRNFMDKYYQEFEDTEENKLIYTPIFNEYISLVEKYIEEQLLERIPGFNMAAFTTTLQHHKDEVAGDIFDMLLTFTDFLAFKEMFLDYRAVSFSYLLSHSEPRRKFQADLVEHKPPPMLLCVRPAGVSGSWSSLSAEPATALCWLEPGTLRNYILVVLVKGVLGTLEDPYIIKRTKPKSRSN